VGDAVEVAEGVAAEILELNWKPPKVPMPWMAGGSKANGDAAGDAEELGPTRRRWLCAA
jgi:hypothetical protein